MGSVMVVWNGAEGKTGWHLLRTEHPADQKRKKYWSDRIGCFDAAQKCTDNKGDFSKDRKRSTAYKSNTIKGNKGNFRYII